MSNLGLCFTQEDPFKLDVLGKDIRRVVVTTADFFFTDNEMSIVTSDDEGIVRVYEYNPRGESLKRKRCSGHCTKIGRCRPRIKERPTSDLPNRIPRSKRKSNIYHHRSSDERRSCSSTSKVDHWYVKWSRTTISHLNSFHS